MECRIEPKVGAVIVAGGKGVRMGGETPKQFRILGQAPILVHSINAISLASKAADIVVVLPKAHIDYWKNLAARFMVAAHRVVEGGEERFDSVKAGIEALDESVDIIAVHDGVRPLCSKELIERCIESAKAHGSAIPAIALSDSLRRVEGEHSQVVDRSTLRAVQTPQTFDAILLRRAYSQSYNPSFTDEGSAVEALGEQITLCEGERSNIKITTEEDLLYAEMILNHRDEQQEDI